MIQFFVTLAALPALLLDRVERNDKGAAMVEYGLLVVGIAVVVGAAALALGGRISTMFGGIVP